MLFLRCRFKKNLLWIWGLVTLILLLTLTTDATWAQEPESTPVTPPPGSEQNKTEFIYFPIILSSGMQSQQAAPASQEIESMPGFEIVEYLDPIPHTFQVPPPPKRRGVSAIQKAKFKVNFNPSTCQGSTKPWPNAAKNAFYYALSIWAPLIDSKLPIEIDACWRTDLGWNVLGSAGSTQINRSNDYPHPDTWYPVALANTFENHDLNGGQAEIIANIANDPGILDWWFTPDSPPHIWNYDFVTLVMHEIAHALGFAGMARVDTVAFPNECSGSANVIDGCILWLGSPASYDLFTITGSGVPLLYLESHVPSWAFHDYLRGADHGVFFNGPNAVAANGGQPVKLYAPPQWAPGTSYSHLDQAEFHNTINALMTPAQAPGETIHDPGPITLGILQDIGWNQVVTNLPPILTVANSVVTVAEGQTALNTGTASDADGDPLTLSASVGTVIDNNDGSWSWSFLTSDGPNESQTVTVSASDGIDTRSITFVLTVNNVPPTPSIAGPTVGSEGSLIVLTGSATDPAGANDTISLVWSVTKDGAFFTNGTGGNIAFTPDNNGSYAVTLTASDEDGGSANTTHIVDVGNAAPIVGPINGSSVVIVGAELTVDASFTDPGLLDTHTAVWVWGDGTTTDPANLTQGAGSGSVADSHTYQASGSYNIELIVTDNDGDWGNAYHSVMVQSPTEATSSLIEAVEAIGGLPEGLVNELTSKLNNALKDLDKGNDNAATGKLGAFINSLEAQRGKKIGETDANALIQMAQQIIDAINNGLS